MAGPMDTTTQGSGRMPDRPCKAKRSNGEPCRKPAILGGTVCATHGGSAPQVRRKAALRLQELIDPAIGVLAREMVTAEKSADRQRAANSVLDRAGMPRTATVIDGESAKALLFERITALRGEADATEDTDEQGDDQ